MTLSVVYVTHGGIDWLRRSLDALRANTEGDYEVIVVDSASPDDTPLELRALDGIRPILLDENVGFGRACNEGAEAARGETLCFLNIDALPEPGWLPPLLERLEEPRVGAAFPMLLNLDGTVQEAGSVVDALGWAHTIGAGADPSDLAVRFARAIDYGSAACMVVERDVFRALGGFDPVYGLGYYEDADFCFKLRDTGLRALYEPRSRVVHARHGSSSRERARELMLANRGHFYGRWATALADRPRTTEIETNPRHAIAARDADALDRILVIDDRVPFADRGSGDPRMAKLLLELADLWPDARITMLAAIPDEIDRYAEPLLRRGIEVACPVGPLGRVVLTSGSSTTRVVIVSRPQNAERFGGWLHETQPQALRVYDIEALSSRQWERKELVAAGDDDRQELRLLAGRTRMLEADTIRASDALFCVSAEEAARAREHDRQAGVRHPEPRRDAPRPADPSPSATASSSSAASSPAPARPNEDAVLHLANDVMPLVWEQLPDVALTVIGADVTPAVRALAERPHRRRRLRRRPAALAEPRPRAREPDPLRRRESS